MTVIDTLNLGRDTRRLGQLANRVQDVGHPEAPPLSVFLDGGVVPRSERTDNHNQLGSDLAKYQLVQPGDLVFNRLRTWQGGFGASRHHGIVSPAYIVARPHDSDARYLDYVLHSAPYLAELVRVSKWMPPSQFDVLWTDLRQVEIPWLPLEEQRRIADFLDHRVARIDQIITARRRQISAVQVSYRSYLAELMKGLQDRYGSVPLRRFASGIEQGWSPEAHAAPAGAGESGVLKLGVVRDGDFRPSENKAMFAGVEPRPEYEVRHGDLLITRANTPLLVGDAAVVQGHWGAMLYLCDLIYRVRMVNYDPGLASAAIRAPHNRQSIAVIARGTSGSMPKLRGEDLLGLVLPAVPPERQEALRADEDRQRASRTARGEALQRSIGLLTEYKQSLITAAVSGDLDVTTAGSGMPA